MAQGTLHIEVRTRGVRRVLATMQAAAILHSICPRLVGRVWHIRTQAGPFRRGVLRVTLKAGRGPGPADGHSIAVDLGAPRRRAWLFRNRRT